MEEKKKKKVVLRDVVTAGGGPESEIESTREDPDTAPEGSEKGGKKKKAKGSAKSDGEDSSSGKKKKRKKGKRDKGAEKKNMVMNARGELVTAAQYALEQTLDATNISLASYRSRMENLIKTNEDLQETCQQQEKDALDVIAALHLETEHKEAELKRLREQMDNALLRAKQDQETMMGESERKLMDMNNVLAEKEAAFRVMQAEFAVIKDFRKKRHELLRELEYQKQELADTERQHKEVIARMERKFFEEKIRLQKEANRKISELATKAHKEAVANLKETTKEVYKENIRMAESLRYHVQEGEELSKQNAMLLRANRQLIEEKDLHNVIVKEKILQAKQQAQEIKDLNLKIQSMEHALSHVVREFEHERDIIGKMARRELDEVRRYADKLRESLKRKSKEMRHIKRLAQHILDQRTDLEAFFMDSLDHIRAEILSNRDNARKAAQADYNRKIRAVMSNKSGIPFPAVQSFRPQAHNNLGPAAAAESILNPTEIPAPDVGEHPTEKGDEMKASTSTQPLHHHSHHESHESTHHHHHAHHHNGQNHHQHHHSHSKPAGGSSDRVDISDLSWEDKERVLRLLFAKMNGVAVAGGPGKHLAGAAGRKGWVAENGGNNANADGGRVGFSAVVPEGREVDIEGDLDLSTASSRSLATSRGGLDTADTNLDGELDDDDLGDLEGIGEGSGKTDTEDNHKMEDVRAVKSHSRLSMGTDSQSNVGGSKNYIYTLDSTQPAGIPRGLAPTGTTANEGLGVSSRTHSRSSMHSMHEELAHEGN
ncbi:hypothetical protein HDU97_004040 [Phlyctochytrium planicorne]|nr:hypothetical protein HDU97_004040 [Phlyctochytrium planicorne]